MDKLSSLEMPFQKQEQLKLPAEIERRATEGFIDEYNAASKAGVVLHLRVKAAQHYLGQHPDHLLVGVGEPSILPEELLPSSDPNRLHFVRRGAGEFIPVTNKVRGMLARLQEGQRMVYLEAARKFFSDNRFAILFDLAQLNPFLSPPESVKVSSDDTEVRSPASFSAHELREIEAAISQVRRIGQGTTAADLQTVDEELTRQWSESVRKLPAFKQALSAWEKSLEEARDKKKQ